MNTEKDRKRGECVCIEIPTETGIIAAAAAGTADSAVNLCPEIRETAAAVTQADRMDIPVIPAAGRTRTAAVLTAIHGTLTVIPAILAAGRNAGLDVMW